MITRLRWQMDHSPRIIRGERISSGTHQLARLTGLHPTLISLYHTGTRPIPIAHLIRIARELDCPPGECVGWMTPQPVD